MKSLVAILVCITCLVARSQTCPQTATFGGHEYPVIQIRNQCFVYDDEGHAVTQAFASIVGMNLPISDQFGLTDIFFRITNISLLNYEYNLSMDGCNPSEDITIGTRINFNTGASILGVPFSSAGTVTANYRILRNYTSTIQLENGVETTRLSHTSTYQQQSLDIDLTNSLGDLLFNVLADFLPGTMRDLVRTSLEEVPSIIKLDDRVIPFGAAITGPTLICSGTPITLSVGEGFDSYLWSTGARTHAITVTEPGTYSVKVIHQCSETTLSTIVEENLVDIRDFILTELDCDHKITLRAPGFSAVEWSTGATGEAIAIATSGMYQATVTDEFGCTGSDKMFVSLPTTCLQPLTLAALCSDVPSVRRRWLISNPNSNSVRVDWEIPGTPQLAWIDVPPGETTLISKTEKKSGENELTIYWHDSNGDIQSASAIGTAAKCAKGSPLDGGNPSSASLYPNPAGDNFSIVVESANDQQISFRILSHSGNVRDQGTFLLNAGKNVIHYDASRLPPGDYVILLGNETIRLVKN